MRLMVLPILLAVIGFASTARAYQITTACQKNTDDGRLLLSDGRIIPEGSRTRILSYTPTRVENVWTFGPCRVDIQPLGRR